MKSNLAKTQAAYFKAQAAYERNPTQANANTRAAAWAMYLSASQAHNAHHARFGFANAQAA